MPFNVDSDKEINTLPEYKASADISFLSELLHKKELNRDEQLQLFTARSLDKINFNLDNIARVALQAHNGLVITRAEARQLREDIETLKRETTPDDTKVKTWFRQNMGLFPILKYFIVGLAGYLLNKYLPGSGH